MGRLWNALTYFTEELGPNFTMPVTKTNCSALGARPGEGLGQLSHSPFREG